VHSERLRVLVTDDSAVMRRAITRIVESDPSLELVGIARNGKDAIEKVNAHRPHVLTLDIEMPVMDGLHALSRLPVDCGAPLPAVLMCSSLTTDGSHAALKALRMGAAEVIGKNPAEVGGGSEAFAREFLAKVHAIGAAKLPAHAHHTPPPHGGSHREAAAPAGVRRPAAPAPPADSVREVVRRLNLTRDPVDLIVIGSSTGGPPALEDTLAGVPREGRPPIVIAQHMPRLFTGCLAERLGRSGDLHVVHAERDVSPLEPGAVYVICGGRHGRVASRREGGWRLELSDHPESALYKPCVNVLFESAAPSARSALAVVLTGMGDDGLKGGLRFVASGGRMVSQDAGSCVVYGMPKAVDEAGLSRGRLPPKDIARVLAAVAEDRAARSAA